MNERDSFSDSIYEEQMRLAERELFSFLTGVTQLYGPEQAQLSAEDWLNESELMDSPPRSEARNWRAVTIAVGTISKPGQSRGPCAWAILDSKPGQLGKPHRGR